VATPSIDDVQSPSPSEIDDGKSTQDDIVVYADDQDPNRLHLLVPIRAGHLSQILIQSSREMRRYSMMPWKKAWPMNVKTKAKARPSATTKQPL